MEQPSLGMRAKPLTPRRQQAVAKTPTMSTTTCSRAVVPALVTMSNSKTPGTSIGACRIRRKIPSFVSTERMKALWKKSDVIQAMEHAMKQIMLKLQSTCSPEKSCVGHTRCQYTATSRGRLQSATPENRTPSALACLVSGVTTVVCNSNRMKSSTSSVLLPMS